MGATEAFIHEQGLVRYAALPYSSDDNAMSDCNVHLTYIRARNKGLYAKTRYRNCTLSDLRTFLRETRGQEAEEQAWEAIGQAVWTTLRSSPLVPQPRPRVPDQGLLDFEFFGFDVML